MGTSEDIFHYRLGIEGLKEETEGIEHNGNMVVIVAIVTMCHLSTVLFKPVTND